MVDVSAGSKVDPTEACAVEQLDDPTAALMDDEKASMSVAVMVGELVGAKVD